MAGLFGVKGVIFVGVFAAIIYFVNDYTNGSVCESQDRIDGKVVVITGANTGIGYETALDLVKRGGRVILACRSVNKANQAMAKIKNETGVKDDKIVVMKLDLSSFKSIRQFAAEYIKREQRLDILINNAGIALVPFHRTEEGFEATFGVNHLGHFLLTNLLMDLIKKSSPSRIVTVSSLGHSSGSFAKINNLEELHKEEGYSSFTSYANSKLANILFNTELAKRLEGTGVTVYVLHPGVVRTELAQQIKVLSYPVIKPIMFALMTPVTKSVWHGAQTSICCAVDQKLSSETGKYYSDCKAIDPLPESLDHKVSLRLWEYSKKVTGLKETI